MIDVKHPVVEAIKKVNTVLMKTLLDEFLLTFDE
jgi:hypothetical protein